MQFVRTRAYEKALKRMKVRKADADAILRTIADNPTAGDVIPGLSGVRKIRFGYGGRGKRGGGRAIYFAQVTEDVTIMLTAYAKSDQSDLSPEQKKTLARIVKELKDG